MKKIRISIYYSILFIFLQVLLGFGVFFGGSDMVFAVNTEKFYFEDYSADYYLSRDSDGVSRLRVVENFTTIFPDFNQNKGICREIPFLNQGGANTTLPKLSFNDVEILRNGAVEPIYSIDKEKNYFRVCTGDESYVLGRQIYTFSYEFSKVVTDFPEHQELYWDTNGNGWAQRFESVSARVHVDGSILDDLTGEAWCYVGRYGDSGQNRCEILRMSDGFSFQARGLASYENLTFDIEFKDETFVVPEPEKNYVLVFALVGISGICLGLIIYAVWKYLKNKEIRDYFNGYFVKPEYQPSDKYSLAELAELYRGKKKDVKVAILLDLIVRKQIELISEGKKKWAFRVLSLDDVVGEEKTLLAILNGGSYVKVGDTVSIVSRKATRTLVDLNQSFYSTIRRGLVSGGMVKDNYVMGESRRGATAASLVINLVFFFPFLTFMISAFILDYVEENLSGLIVLKREFPFLVGAVLFVTILVWTVFSSKANRFKNITKEGVRAEKYMEGLELYIRMAEKDRLEFLQSVDGADVSPKGVVKLYEKLLPYAAVFGLEKSWMEEMERYCEVEEISEPSYLTTGFAISEISRITNQAVTAMDSATRMASSGGGSSSGFSGGGGGGFSGGGGGGGGGGGR